MTTSDRSIMLDRTIHIGPEAGPVEDQARSLTGHVWWLDEGTETPMAFDEICTLLRDLNGTDESRSYRLWKRNA